MTEVEMLVLSIVFFVVTLSFFVFILIVLKNRKRYFETIISEIEYKTKEYFMSIGIEDDRLFPFDKEVVAGITRKFNKTDYYNNVGEKSQTFTIKPNEEKSKCSGTLTQSPTSRTPPYQTWSDLYSDCTASNYQRCGRETSSDSDAKTLGSSAGSYRQPAKLIKKDWDLGVPNNAVIKSVHVIWAEKQTNGPSVSFAKPAFINIKKVTLKTSGAITYEKTINTNSGGPSDGGSWVTHNLSLGTSFNPKKKLTLTLAYGPNTATNTGTIYLKGPKVIVEYVPAQS